MVVGIFDRFRKTGSTKFSMEVYSMIQMAGAPGKQVFQLQSLQANSPICWKSVDLCKSGGLAQLPKKKKTFCKASILKHL